MWRFLSWHLNAHMLHILWRTWIFYGLRPPRRNADKFSVMYVLLQDESDSLLVSAFFSFASFSFSHDKQETEEVVQLQEGQDLYFFYFTQAKLIKSAVKQVSDVKSEKRSCGCIWVDLKIVCLYLCALQGRRRSRPRWPSQVYHKLRLLNTACSTSFEQKTAEDRWVGHADVERPESTPGASRCMGVELIYESIYVCICACVCLYLYIPTYLYR